MKRSMSKPKIRALQKGLLVYSQCKQMSGWREVYSMTLSPISIRPDGSEDHTQSVRHTTTTAQREMHKYAGEIARNIDAAYILCGNTNEQGQQHGICNDAIKGCSLCHAYGSVKLCYLANYQRLSEVLRR